MTRSVFGSSRKTLILVLGFTYFILYLIAGGSGLFEMSPPQIIDFYPEGDPVIEKQLTFDAMHDSFAAYDDYITDYWINSKLLYEDIRADTNLTLTNFKVELPRTWNITEIYIEN